MRTYEEPVTVPGNGKTNDTETSHPAFASIRASRVSGHATLFQSDFRHQYYMTVSISKALLMRGLSNDWVFDRGEYIEVAMSESQWATFISTPNAASTPCTLQHLNREPVPQLRAPPDTTKQFSAEMRKCMADAVAHVDILDAAIDDMPGLSDKRKAELKSHARMIRMRISSSLAFTAEQFGEHMERTTERAKQEISGYMEGAIRRAGLHHIKMQGPLLLDESQSIAEGE